MEEVVKSLDPVSLTVLVRGALRAHNVAKGSASPQFRRENRQHRLGDKVASGERLVNARPFRAYVEYLQNRPQN